MPKPVTSKAQFVKLYQDGVFGNRAPTWNSLDRWYDWWTAEHFDAPESAITYRRFHVRNRVANGKTFYNLGPDFNSVVTAWNRLVCEYGPGTAYISEMAPHHLGTAQGEVQRSVHHLDLTITTGRLPMREALLTDYTTFVQGLRADILLRHFMDPPSYEWLQYLLDTYVDHVVEFSCFSRPWGTVPNRNTVFWETRLY